MNIVIIKGNLARDPELRYTPTGKAVASTAVAVNESWTGADGQKQERVDFINVEFWGKTAETVAQYFRKGKAILVQGKIRVESWEDKKTNEKKYKTKVQAERFEFCDAHKEGDATSRSSAARPAAAAEPAAEGGHGADVDDDVPF